MPAISSPGRPIVAEAAFDATDKAVDNGATADTAHEVAKYDDEEVGDEKSAGKAEEETELGANSSASPDAPEVAPLTRDTDQAIPG